MEYFWLRMDTRMKNGVRFETLTSEELLGGQPIVRQIMPWKGIEATIYPDYLTTRTIRGQYHLISDSLKALFSIYLPEVEEWMPFILVDQEKISHLYWFLIPKKVEDGISEQTTYHHDRTINHLVLKEELLDSSIFYVETELQRLIILKLDAAESVLRRGFCGIHLQKVGIEK